LDPLVLMGLTFLLLLGLGVPVAFVLGISSLIYFLLSDQIIFINVIAERFFSGMNLFVLMAIPLFIFMGEILNKSNITKELVDFADILVGRFRGGLAHVNIVVSTLFAGITGSALSDISALGSLLIPAMEEQGYDTEFSAAVTVASSLQGPIIPPSIPAVLVAGVSGISVGGVFLGGAIPGLMFGLSCIVITIIRSKQRNYPKHVIKMTFSIIWTAFKTSFLALITPVIVIGGMLGGVFTPTEAAAIASTYALFLTFVVRKTSLKELKQITYNVVTKSGQSNSYSILFRANKPLPRFKNPLNAIKYGAGKRIALSSKYSDEIIKSQLYRLRGSNLFYEGTFLSKSVKKGVTETRKLSKVKRDLSANDYWGISPTKSVSKTKTISKREFKGLITSPKDYFLGSITKTKKELQELKFQWIAQQNQAKVLQIEQKLKVDFPDLEQVVNDETIEVLKARDKSFAKIIDSQPQSVDELYNRAVSAYTLIKKYGIYVEDNHKADRARVEKNMSKPRPVSTAAATPSEGLADFAQFAHLNDKERSRAINKLARQRAGLE